MKYNPPFDKSRYFITLQIHSTYIFISKEEILSLDLNYLKGLLPKKKLFSLYLLV